MTVQAAVFNLLILVGCVCVTEQCRIKCPDGQIPDTITCKCQPDKPIRPCPIPKCAGMTPPCMAYNTTAAGCPTCTCLCQCPERKCPNCKEVELFDDQFGCPSCRCRQPNCPSNTCSLYCAKGYETDEKGCDLCKCKPCGDLCEIGCPYKKLVDFDGCEVCDCIPSDECRPVCFNNFCPNGRLLDYKKCPTSRCL